MVRNEPKHLALALLAVVAACGDGSDPDAGTPEAESAAAETGSGQELIQLPADFAPEGIAIGEDGTFYVGSLAGPTTGQILAGNLETGETRQVVAPRQVPALGLRHDSRTNLLYVAGGDTGRGHAYDAATGAQVAEFQFAEGALINDVEVTDRAVYFTDSRRPALYRVALGADGRPGEVSTLDLPPNFGQPGACPGVPPIQGNGIAATPDGRYILLIHMSEGIPYRMDTQTGEALPIELSGGDMCSADGLLLDGDTLYGVKNMTNQVVVVELGSDLLTGTVTAHITEPFASNPAIKIPTTIAHRGDYLYAVTAGFAEPSPDYVVRMQKPE